MDYRKVIKWSIGIAILSTLGMLFRRYNPLENNYFPKCMFLEITGYKCPGCGSQRAIHDLLNLDVIQAFKENAILLLFIPYILTGIVFDTIKEPNQLILTCRKSLFGQRAIVVIISIILGFWILRNI